MKKKISITIEEKILNDIDFMVDFIYIRNRSQAIEHLIRNSLGENKTAVILAGGPEAKLRLDNSYRTTTKIGNKTIIEIAIKKLRENGFKNIFIVARHKILTSVFELLGEGTPYGVKINYVEEKESKGTASSLKILRGKINNTFLVVYSDIIFKKINLKEIWEDHLKLSSIATLMLTTSPLPSKKGIVKMEGSNILKFVQKPKISDIYLGFSSIFVTEPEILEYEGNSLENDVFPALAEKGLLKGHVSSEKEIHIHTKQDLKNLKIS